MNEFEIIYWPECQELMEEEGFNENSTLIEPNESIGIGSCTYLVCKDWLDSLKQKKGTVKAARVLREIIEETE